MELLDKPKKKRGGKRPGAGRKPSIQIIDKREQPTSIVIDLSQVELMARMGCTQEDMAIEFGVSLRTFAGLIKKNSALKEVVSNGGTRGKTSARRMLWKKATKGDTASIIFLNKAMNGMSDRVAHTVTGKDGKPIQIETTDASVIRERIEGKLARLSPEITPTEVSEGVEPE